MESWDEGRGRKEQNVKIAESKFSLLFKKRRGDGGCGQRIWTGIKEQVQVLYSPL